jgi:hypothetical protein
MKKKSKPILDHNLVMAIKAKIRTKDPNVMAIRT